MKKVLWIWLLAGLFLLLPHVQGAGKPSTWEVKSLTDAGTFDYDLDTGIVTATNGVVVTYGDARLIANRLTLDEKSGDVVAEGMVNLQREGQLWQGDRLEYNFLTKKMKAEQFKVGQVPYYAGGFGLSGEQTNDVYSSYFAYITTDDLAEPLYRIRAKTLVIVPGDSFHATDATVYIGKVPVMYWPSYRRTLKRHPNNWVLVPGYRSLYGPYLLSSYNWYLNTNLSGALNFDYRQKRGIGVGPDFNYNAGKWGEGMFRYYYLHDDEPRTNSLALPIPGDRQRFYFTHRTTLRTNLTATAVVRKQNDEYVIRDFFETEYRDNIQPSTFLEVNQLWRNYSLNILAQPQVNDFFETVERLPDVKLTAAPQQLGPLPLYYDGESSVGYFRHQFANNIAPEYAAWRADTYHQLTLPQTFFGWLNVAPRVGGRFTHYGEAEGSGITFTDHNRGLFNTGGEVSFKASQTWNDVRSKFWDVDGLRHIVRPSVNYVYVPRPQVLPTQLPQFDPVFTSYRLLPIEFPDFNAIDAIDSQNVIRFSLDNKFLTRRDSITESLVNWAIYTDWRLRPRPGQGTFADVFSDLDFKPRRWMTLSSENRYDVGSGHLVVASHSLTLAPNNVWSVQVGHFYVKGATAFIPGLGDNLIHGSFYYRLNENWGLRTTHYFEARDGRMEEQDYSLYHDLRSWTAALTFRLRQSRGGPDDFTVAVTFSLKAFPRFHMGNDSLQHSLLLGD